MSGAELMDEVVGLIQNKYKDIPIIEAVGALEGAKHWILRRENLARVR